MYRLEPIVMLDSHLIDSTWNTMTAGATETELRARHRAMWASEDCSRMVDTFLLPLGPPLVDACDIVARARGLDVAAGPGNASLPAAAVLRGLDESHGRGPRTVGE